MCGGHVLATCNSCDDVSLSCTVSHTKGHARHTKQECGRSTDHVSNESVQVGYVGTDSVLLEAASTATVLPQPIVVGEGRTSSIPVSPQCHQGLDR